RVQPPVDENSEFGAVEPLRQRMLSNRIECRLILPLADHASAATISPPRRGLQDRVASTAMQRVVESLETAQLPGIQWWRPGSRLETPPTTQGIVFEPIE